MGLTRREFLQTSAAGLAGISLYSLLGQRASAAPEQNRPNILWVSIEDLNPHLGCYGDPIAQSPTIDRLAEDGMRFTNAFTPAGVCAPCRSSIITGMYQNSIGTQHMRTSHRAPGLPTPYEAVPPPYVKTFTEYLRAAGYYCTNNKKTDYQFGLPFTAWDESSGEAHWRNRPDPNQPFFAVFNFTTTHESQNWKEPEQTDPAVVEVPPYYPDTLPVRKDLARQYDNIALVDKQIGEVLSQLEADGLREETIVFFWSDHGDGLPRAKRWLYDSGLHVPLIVRWPGEITPGTVNENMVSFVDLGPTVLSMAGVPVPVHMQGKAFLGDQAAEPREYIYGARDRFDESYDMVRAVRDKRYKYIRNYYPNQPYVLHLPYRNRNRTMQELIRLDTEGKLTGPQKLWMRDTRPPEELYDTEKDPYEIHNLANDPKYKSILQRKRSEMDRWMEEIDDLGDIPEEQMVERMWPGHVQPETHAPLILQYGSTDMEPLTAVNAPQPVTVVLYSSTQGASLGYTTDTGDNPAWQLYTGPITPPRGKTTLRAKAIRYGYKESGESVARFSIG